MTKQTINIKKRVIGWILFLSFLIYCNIFSSIKGYAYLEGFFQKILFSSPGIIRYAILMISFIPILIFAYGVSIALVDTKLYKSLTNKNKNSVIGIYILVSLSMFSLLLIINFAYNFR